MYHQQSFVCLVLAVLAIGCSPSEEELDRRGIEARAFCASPQPLSFASEASNMTVWIMSVEDGPTGLQVNREWSGPHLWELSLPDGYRYAHREEKPAFLVCSKADYQVVEKREFVRRGAKSPSTFYRTRNQTTMTVYEAKGGTSLHTAEFTGPEPVAFPAEIGDRLGVEFVGGIDRVKRRAALKEGLP